MGKINAPGLKRNWALRCVDFVESRDEAERLACELGHSDVFSQILINRGYCTKEKAEDFLSKRTESFYDPFLMADMEKAVERIKHAVESGENIVIYGDYDVDGVTSVSVFKLYLSSKGANVSYFIPSRCSDGYGLAKNSIDTLIGNGAELIVTVDTGITACEEIAYANSRGIDIVVTDHHECRCELPAAVAVVNPHRSDCGYPFKELAGVGVIFKLICALECAFCLDEPQIECIKRISYEYADLVTLGTIADVMPVVDENRLIVSLGLAIMNKKQRVGIAALVKAAGSADGDGKNVKINKNKKITSGYIGYTLAPRINAAGRICDATIAAELLLEEDEIKAELLAQELCEINRMRQKMENETAEEASRKMITECDAKNDHVIVLADEGWHQGIIGIVASRISEKYGKPALLISFEGGDNSVGKGSGRSVGRINLVDALSNSSEFLLKYGGHALAAGLSIKREDLDDFRRAINEYVKNTYGDDAGAGAVIAEMEVDADDMTLSLAQELYALEPYGVSNPTPLFMMRNLTVMDAVSIGSDRHTKLMLSRDDSVFPALCFGTSSKELDIMRGDKVDVLFNIDINEYQNVKTLQFIVRDIRLSGNDLHAFESQSTVYDAILSGEDVAYGDDVIPVRDEFASVYNYLRKNNRDGYEMSGVRTVSLNSGVGMAKLKFIVDIFAEMGIIDLEKNNDEVFSYKMNDVNRKIDLDKSRILQKLKEKRA